MSELNGLLLIDKAADMTSHDVVARARRILQQKSVGHTGTLDPLATGLMILVLGEATKLSDYLTMADKAYGMKVRLGITTDTLDRTGQILSETPCNFTPDEIVAQVKKLEGDFQWPVPVFSATKVDGKKLYEYGRKGEDVVLPVKPMSFREARIEECGGQQVQVHISCSKGSFIRTWAAQLGAALGVGGIIEELRRTRVGQYDVHEALTLEALEERRATGAYGPAYIPMARALPSWKALIADGKEARLVANGQVPRDMMNRLVYEQKQAFQAGAPVYVKVINPEGALLAILAAEPGQGLKIRRVFRSFP